jgi:hypothetical protein
MPRTRIGVSVVYLFEMGNRQGSDLNLHSYRRLLEEVPRPTASFRRRAWLEFQRALDPLGPPRPMRRGRPRDA